MPADRAMPVHQAMPVDQAIAVVHVDPWLLVVHKPSGLLSQPGRGPALADSLLTRLQCHWPELLLVHRLDRDTSGLLLLARDPHTHRRLSTAFAERRVHKAYLAVVEGTMGATAGRIDEPLARWATATATAPPRYGPVPVGLGGKPALTRWRLLGARGQRSLLLLVPHTGRSHQLRVHLASVGHPIVGDPIYGLEGASGRLMLHGLGLRLRHPHTARALRLRCLPRERGFDQPDWEPWGDHLERHGLAATLEFH